MLGRCSNILGICFVLANTPALSQEISKPNLTYHSKSAKNESDRPPFPIVIIESDETTTYNRLREEKADVHEAADLEAQELAAFSAERSATATEDQLGPIWASVILSAVAAILSVGALAITGWTAWRTDRTSRDELRAYVTLTPFWCSSFDENHACAVKVRVQNDGSTPARKLRHAMNIVLVRNYNGTPKAPGPEHDPSDYDTEIGISLSRSSIVVHERPADRLFTPKELEELRSGEVAIGILVKATYEDVFGKSHLEMVGVTLKSDADSLLKLTNNYLGTDLKVDYLRIPNYGEST